MGTTVTIGIDVGNYDTKTQHTLTPSSYRVSETKNQLADESICYNGLFYTSTRERNNQQTDKTKDNYCVNMSLFAIAKEIIWQIQDAHFRKHGNRISDKLLQQEISNIDSIVLGVGLPVGHFSALAAKTRACYEEAFKNGISFEYNHYTFSLRLRRGCRTYPQDFTAVAFNRALSVPKKYSEYYIIGIGGGTVDIIPVFEGKPQIEKCKTLELGSTVMYEYISTALQHETGDTISYSSIESILNNEETIIKESRKTRVRKLAEDFINQLVDEFLHVGLRLQDYPCVFVGGGALLMRDTLEENQAFALCEFVEDVHANAKYYAEFAEKNL